MPIPKYYSNFDEANKYTRLMLDLLRKFALPPNLVNITLCYEYVTGNDKRLQDALDNIFNQAENYTAEKAEALFKDYIWDEEKRTHDKLNKVLNKHFAEVLLSVNKVRSNAGTSSTNLKKQSQKLKSELSKPKIKHIVNNIVSETDRLVHISQLFEKELEIQKEELDQLKTELKQTKELAETDPLTKLKNRRAFEIAINENFLKTSSNDQSLCLLILDIDFFKQVNDKYGHLVGDKVLYVFAQMLIQNLKGKDLAARIGGEEFAILLPETQLTNAIVLAENLRKIIAKSRLTISKTKQKLDHITVSIGVTLYKQGESMESFINRADRALYSSKNNGRNRVTSF